MALYDNLFEPIQVGPVTIPNRIVRSAHGTHLGGDDLIAYHEARARGGVGMSTLEATGVHHSARTHLPLHSDDILPFYEKISRRMHQHGMKLFQQIYHSGASGGGSPDSWSVSGIPNPMIQVMPFVMTKTQIDDVVASFGAAARRVRDGGLDGVDIHASSGYLIHEFLSPALNRREDEYGGSRENRMRFLMEVIAAIRAEVGHDIAVGVRLPNEDYVPGGLTAEENAAIAQVLDPHVDYVSLHMGAYWRFHKLIAPSDDPLGVEMIPNKVITRGVTKPTIVVGRIMTLDHASSIVGSGEATMVSMVRALIADPELVNKGRRLEEHKIRPCVGTNMGCVGQLMTRGVISCVVNVAAAQERTVSFEPEDKVTQPKKILIVGGGPAGLEAARTLALRGHKVELHDAMRRLGGQVAMAADAPHRADVGQITRWLESEIETLGVEVHLNSMVDADMVAEIAPDEVIVATGTTPRYDGFQVATPSVPVPGWDLPHVHNSWELFGVGGKPDIKGPAVVFDDTGTFEAISVADVLLQAGVPVTMVSRTEQLGQNVPFPPVTVGAARERLMSADFDFIGGHYIRNITSDEVEIGVLFTDRVRRIPAKTVVLVSFNQPNRDLAEQLAARFSNVKIHLVGDVRGRNSMMTAIHEAAEVARAI
ncbi:FAD-dependent oxidoreductase [Iodidimonas sp. SYSU 1G8]|uniref:oxidoreductase n=1 Tax=Iodidimonas sp. SYSU 1G8 TaxID=3133967 RepID=UPI0031FF0137